MSKHEPAPPPSLYASREPIFPKRVKGFFRSLKWYVMAVTLLIYYVTPWIRWDRGPNMPDQAVLVDLAHRRFFFFWIEIWPHEFYFVAGLLVMAGLGLFLFTSALGRVWCGYACPQTVWTDLFILVERWIEGDRNNRIRLHRQNWTGQKVRLRLMKWTAWLLIALLTGGAWVFYFTDAPTLLVNLFTLNAHPVAYITIAILTATTFFFGGFAREQICIYACPWPRIQAAMMDESTLTVGYRDWRGEPRGKSSDTRAGDCIDCMACVNVCPMGIDIRDGQQMECITCALCIDACDEIMDRTGKPRGLIDYLTLHDEQAERAGAAPKPIMSHILRPRTLLYFGLWASIGVLLVVALFMRSAVDLNVSPVRNPTYVMLSDGAIRNTYEIRLRNKQHDILTYDFAVEGADDLILTIEGEADTSAQVDADQTLSRRLYLTAPAGSPLAQPGAGNRSVTLFVQQTDGSASTRVDTVFHGRGQ
ncbi:cytochrome c oxidase accessory protein CcoG [Paracoccus sp. (in: a-proteobacteria)]|uniref:cytochrome c oxidase accessory protein CcoG n=1 Tax=Paracoccus sp. TaxID=267 RepID=UPI0026DF64E1|nr:cytochrome c oxidase accessory protein CcoG [Paracoccus sp. (in: a-proteobacteria)]MDO5647296.1 cytochrome c oxidase accessory protein CcoG [Paracoccus sp. (in: a-proteobacteria)]